jgi:plastocyanin
MNLKYASLIGLFLCIISGCSGGDQPATPLPPVTPAAAPASPFDGYQVIQVTDGGSITGTIKVSGNIPKLPPRPIGKDPNVCGTGTRESLQLMVGSGGALKNAVVIVEGVRAGKALPPNATSVQLDQKNCEYGPHVMIVPVKSELSIRNSDPILHNIHMYQDDESLFNIAQPVQNQENKHALTKAGFVYAECDVHGWMQAHIAVVDNPYYAVTDENGKFNIADLPPGNYTVKIWHEYLGEKTQNVTIAAGAAAPLDLDLKDLLDAKRPAAITAAPAPVSAPAAAPGATKTAASAPAAPVASARPASGDAQTVTVRMLSVGTAFRFEPDNITIKAGTTVKWVNESENRHSATADPRFEKKAGQTVLPAGAMPFSSPFFPNGGEFSHTFTVPGDYRYFCRNHEQFGMIAGIKVVP